MNRLTYLFALATLACSSNGAATNDTSRYLGRWTYQAGSTVAIDCPGAPTQTIDLAHVVPGNQPAFFTLAAAASAGVVDEVDARGCAYSWTIVDGVATANPNQSCATFPDGRGGSQVVHLQNGTKTTSDGVSLTVDVHFTNDNNCAIHVTGSTSHS